METLNLYKYQINGNDMIHISSHLVNFNETLQGQLTTYADITRLEELEHLVDTFISYTQYKRYLDRWYEYHQGQNNTEVIERNHYTLARHCTIPRSQIFERYGNNAYYMISEYHRKSVNSRRNLYDVAVTMIRKSLLPANQVMVLGTVLAHNLEEKYVWYGIEGTRYQDPAYGIMDYVESTSVFENSGLSVSDFEVQGTTMENLVSDLKQILVYGNYSVIGQIPSSMS